MAMLGHFGVEVLIVGIIQFLYGGIMVELYGGSDFFMFRVPLKVLIAVQASILSGVWLINMGATIAWAYH